MGASSEKGSKKHKNDVFLSGKIEGIKTAQSLTSGKENEKQDINENKNDKKYIELNEFMNEEIIQVYLSKNKEQSNDKIFNELKAFEKKELLTIYNNLKNDYQNNILKKQSLNFSIDNTLISNIIKSENTTNVYKNKIIKEISSIKIDDNKYRIEYLTVLLVGRRGIGKTTLINYMLKLDEQNDLYQVNDNKVQKENFVTYKSNKVPHLKLVEFKGIGLDQDNDPEIIGQEALECIRGEVEKNKNNNYNDFIHCIWYCITGTRLENSEINVLNKLRNAYNEDKKIPVIMVYTQSVDDNLTNNMKKYIETIDKKLSFVKVVAKDINLMNKKIIKTSGNEELIQETLKKCTKALKGNMISLMTQTISNVIVNKMKNINLSIEERINEKVIKQFIDDYKCVLNDEELKIYIVKLLGENLLPFYKNYNQNISNKSLNLLKESKIIKTIENYIKNCKKELEKIINPIIDSEAKILLDKQATLEKTKTNMDLVNKRNLYTLKKTTETFLKRNLYYISQKYIINTVIRKLSWKFYMNYREEIDSIIKTLLTLDNDIEIKNLLEDCYLTKLEKFAKFNKLEITIVFPKVNLSNEKPEKKDEEFNTDSINQDSIDLKDNFDIEEIIDNNNNKIKNEDNWFPFKKRNWNSLNEESKKSLRNFMQNDMIYQDSYLNKKDDYDEVLNALKKYERNNLINYFDFHKKIFIIDKINMPYIKKHIYCNKLLIYQIISDKDLADSFTYNLNDEIEKLILDKNFCKMKYLSILVIGKSGVGKSSLIKSMLKLKNMDNNQNIDKPFKSKEIPFLRIFDTKGISLNNDFKSSNILKSILNVIDNHKKNIEKEKSENYNNYINDYIQCIWYCISSNNLQKNEIDFIKELKKKRRSLPLILIFTKAENRDIVNNIYKQIKEELKDIPFIPVSNKSLKDSTGLDNLLNETLDAYKNAKKGNIYKLIREKSFETIEKKYKEKNKSIKINLINKIINNITKDFNKVLTDDELLKYVFDLFESIFLEFIESYNKKDIKLTQENKDFKNITNIPEFLTEYNKHYKDNTEIIINSVIEEKAIEFLDEQIKKEKKEFTKCLNFVNKSNKSDFMNIIRTFLTDNYYYISQKYFIYRVITDVLEDIVETVEMSVNGTIRNWLNQRNPQDILENVYLTKFEDFEKEINKSNKNNKIYNDNEKQIILDDVKSQNYEKNNYKQIDTFMSVQMNY